MPPSTVTVVPVAKADASLARYTAAPTISVGSAIRLISIWSYIRAVHSGFAAPGAIMSVMNGPGAISLTRTPQLAHSFAMTSVRACSAAFDEQYKPSPGPGRNAPVVITLTIDPPPSVRMRSAHRDASHIGPSVLVA